jgi:hypothetical protein
MTLFAVGTPDARRANGEVGLEQPHCSYGHLIGGPLVHDKARVTPSTWNFTSAA